MFQMMKPIVVLLFFAGVALARSCKLNKYDACNDQACACVEGLSCRVTKRLHYQGQQFDVKQCMAIGSEIETEELTDQDVEETLKPGSTVGTAAAFWYPGKKCTSAEECVWPNTCCAGNKYCAIKLPQYFTCYFTNFHKCGCMDGLTCKTTTHITLPIVNIKFPIRQCVKEE